ncbi:MAG: hypothetical protein ACE5OZ_07260 [Candidatus Heimdallarchaeota archaeon]
MPIQAKKEECEKEVIPLPEGYSFRLEDIFSLELCTLNDRRSLLTLRVIFFPPDKLHASPETSTLVLFLKNLRELLLLELGKSEFEQDYAVLEGGTLLPSPHHWLFGPFRSEWSKVLRPAQIEPYLSRIVALLKRLPAIFPDEFGECDWIRQGHGEDWLEKALIKGKVVE